MGFAFAPKFSEVWVKASSKNPTELMIEKNAKKKDRFQI